MLHELFITHFTNGTLIMNPFTFMGRLIRWGENLIMITPFWQDQSLFPDTMCLVIELMKRFRPLHWLLWNASSREAFSKVMKGNQLTSWRLTSPIVPEVASERKLPGKLLTPGQKVPNRTTSTCLNSGVLSVIRGSYHSLRFVSATC